MKKKINKFSEFFFQNKFEITYHYNNTYRALLSEWQTYICQFFHSTDKKSYRKQFRLLIKIRKESIRFCPVSGILVCRKLKNLLGDSYTRTSCTCTNRSTFLIFIYRQSNTTFVALGPWNFYKSNGMWSYLLGC